VLGLGGGAEEVLIRPAPEGTQAPMPERGQGAPVGWDSEMGQGSKLTRFLP
jgi:hypothetical protein